MNAVSRTLMVALVVLMAAPANPLAAAELEGTWEKLADAPRDLAGREMPPGSDGAWIYVPEWKAFLLYGGCSPTLSNEGWFFDPDKRTWTVLWPHDAFVRDKDQTWKVRLPRDLSWSLDRPGPGRAHGVARDPKTGLIYFFGGFPAFDHSRHFGPDPRLTRQSWLGDAKLGTWALDPTTGQFRHLTDSGPTGLTRGVYDPVSQTIVATPAFKGPYGEGKEKPGITWTYRLPDGKWKAGLPDDGPRAFHYSGVAYDAKVKQTVCFNGYGETWTYDAERERWTNMKPEKSPPARRHAAMCYDDARGVTILHGGVHHPRSGIEAFSIHKSHNGIHHADTWCYDAVRNEWTELKPANSPPRTPSARDLAAYDSDRKMVVFYDVAVGVWGFRFKGDDPPKVKAPGASKVIHTESRPKPPLDEAARKWQTQLASLPENTWLDLQTPLPSQGCMNISFDPVNHCLVMLGGCGGAMFPGPDDFSYNNQVWLLDMQVGRFALRRNHHVWGPDDAEFKLTRLGPGCTRGNCFDGTRNVIWTAGGNGWSGVGAYSLQSYDVASDRFSRAGTPNPWGGGESGMFVHDAKNDKLVYLDGRRSGKTYIYDPKTGKYSDGGPCPPSISEGLSMFSARVYDSELGVIAIVPSLRDWKVGDPRFKKDDISAETVVMRTFAYDVTTQKWRDLAPTNQDKVPICGMPGIAYDSRNRAIMMVKSDHGDIKPLDPTVPYGSLWVLDLAKNSWSELKAGPSTKLYMASMTYDPRLNLILCRFAHKGLWAYRWKGECPEKAFAIHAQEQEEAEPPTCTGTITSFPLPANRLAPYSSVRGSKHTNMATDGKRLYVTGGDWLHSATDGTWSVDLATGNDWREEVGKPVHPTLPAPHALQDGAGFVWVAAKSKFLIWPGGYFPYEKEGTPIRDYSRGMWWFDPATKTFTQELGLFGKYGETSGCLHGGVYDEVNEQIIVLGDDSQGMACKRWSVKELKKLPDIPYKIAPPESNKKAVASYFTRSQYAKIGRHVYVVGVSTDGAKLKIPRFWRWDLDKHTLTELAPPPVDPAKLRELNTRLAPSGDKVVWPYTSGPEGEIDGIYVYDTKKDVWAVDRQVPKDGAFIGNAVASLPDGRVVWSGGAFGRQQTHLWFYKPE